jgi:membrane protein DedA with SNARE-associated domain
MPAFPALHRRAGGGSVPCCRWQAGVQVAVGGACGDWPGGSWKRSPGRMAKAEMATPMAFIDQGGGPSLSTCAPPPAMAMDAYARHIIAFVRQHESWATPLVFALAFGESLAFLSLVLPAWAALVGIGALTGASGLPFWPLWIAGALGAALGDWLSYWIGTQLGGTVIRLWPLSRYPGLLPQGEAFVQKWGVASIFLGRFFGPLRASVPLAAGICAMPFWPFQYANVSSALVWAAVLLTLGDTGAKILHWLWR